MDRVTWTPKSEPVLTSAFQLDGLGQDKPLKCKKQESDQAIRVTPPLIADQPDEAEKLDQRDELNQKRYRRYLTENILLLVRLLAVARMQFETPCLAHINRVPAVDDRAIVTWIARVVQVFVSIIL